MTFKRILQYAILNILQMKKYIILENVSTEQLVNLIEKHTQKALKKFKKEQDTQPSTRRKNNCHFFKILPYILHFTRLLLEAFHL